MLFKPKLVQFKDGSYGARFFSIFGYRYIDLKPNCESYTWWRESIHFKDCRGSKEAAIAAIKSRIAVAIDCGVVINND